MKNVLIISGSPRRRGNTFKITKLVEEKMAALGDMNFEYLALKDLNLAHCRGCMVCMKNSIGGEEFVPGVYAKKKPGAAEMADNYIREWEERWRSTKERASRPEMLPTICFSRKIGVGALEVADILAEKIGCRVIDREILEYIANQADLSEKTVAIYDERYKGKINEFFTMVFGEKAFVKSDYTRHLFSAIYSIACLEPVIFVGRGAHLLLPREQVLAVRFISSKENRIKRLTGILDVEKEEVESILEKNDKEQRDFFKKVYGRSDAPPYEFDIIINCDFISDPQLSAEIVEHVFKEKFKKS